jgi:uncharacterized protein (DUF2342 family)
MRSKNPMHQAIKEAVADAIALEDQAAERRLRAEARRREAAAAPPRDPLDASRTRLAEIEARLPDLRRIHQAKGDALAGRLIETLEHERKALLLKIGAPRK